MPTHTDLPMDADDSNPKTEENTENKESKQASPDASATPTKPAAKADGAEPKEEAKKPDTKKQKRKRKKILTIIAIVLLVIALIWFIYWLFWGRFEIYTDDAYVNGNTVRIMPQISGTITSINTDNTLLVNEGQVLLTLDKADAEISFQRAVAILAETVRGVRQLYEMVIQTQSVVTLRKSNLDKTILDLKRRQGLVGEKAISREEMQHYQVFVDNAQAQYDDAVAKYNAALAQVINTTLYTHPMVKASEVSVRNAYLTLQRTTVYAPVTGFVAQRFAQVGQQVNANTSLMAIIPLNQVWVDANYKESQLERLRIGQPVALTVDAYGDTEFHGKVYGLSPGTGSAFDLLPPQNATGNWIKIVQRVPVRVYLDPEELKKHPLRIGLSARVTTKTFEMNGDILKQTPVQQTLYSTDIFSKQLADADELIDHIVRENGPDVSLDTMHVKKGVSLSWVQEGVASWNKFPSMAALHSPHTMYQQLEQVLWNNQHNVV